MGDVAGYLALVVEEDDLGSGPPTWTQVVKDETVHADEERHRLEVESRILLETCGEYARNASLPTISPSGFPASMETSGDDISTSSVQRLRMRSRSRAFHAAYHSSANCLAVLSS